MTLPGKESASPGQKEAALGFKRAVSQCRVSPRHPLLPPDAEAVCKDLFPQSCHRGSLFGCGGGRREEEGGASHHHQGPGLATGLTR